MLLSVTMDYSSALAELGLNAHEADVYLFLLRNGACQAPQIQAALDLDKMPTYRAINSLRGLGYVDSIGETRNQQFTARPIDTLLNGYDEKINKLSMARIDIEAMARSLVDQNALYKDRRVQVYEGVDGYRVWLEERLKKNIDVIREIGRQSFIEQLFDPEEIESYMTAYIKRRVEKKIRIRTLDSDAEDVPGFDRSNRKLLKETRTVSIPARIDGFVSIFGSRFGFFTKQSGKYVGVIIEDAMAAEMFTFMFDSLWESGADS